jgi:mitochondrial fission protein ELM1
MLSAREGDNAQVLALAEALGWPFEVRRFENRPGALVANLLLGPTLRGLVRGESSVIRPPWPDLVIAAGTQSEPVCRRIRRQAERDGHRVRQIFLGRPWGKPHHYDLVVPTPQYQVPHGPNVLQIDLPLVNVTAERIAQQAAVWAPRIGDLPRPHIAVLIGGSINRYTFDSRAATRLALEASALAASLGGSLLVSSSYRTPLAPVSTLEKNLGCPAYVFRWLPAPHENPYLAFLGLADAIIVTGDSISMLAEACTTGKPVHIFDLGEGRYGMRPQTASSSHLPVAPPWHPRALRAMAKDLKVRLINRCLPRRLHRDTRHIHRQLVESGAAAWLGEPLAVPRRLLLSDNARRVADRVVALVGSARTDAPSGE